MCIPLRPSNLTISTPAIEEIVENINPIHDETNVHTLKISYPSKHKTLI